jgi:hypothetical protein
MSTLAAAQIAEALKDLTQMQRTYVEQRLNGSTQIAAATAAGMSSPSNNANKLESSPNVQRALKACREITADAVAFGRKEAHDMLMQAYFCAATAMEMVAAVNALVKLHGIAAPEVKELRMTHEGVVKHQHRVENMSDAELLKLAALKDSPFIEGEFSEVVPDTSPEAVCLPSPAPSQKD